VIEYSFKLIDGSRIDANIPTGLLPTCTIFGIKFLKLEKDDRNIYIDPQKIVSITVKET
jgi:hypothetical protein